MLVCKSMTLGGPDRVHNLAARARGAGVAVVVTITIDVAITRLGALHAMASFPGGRTHELATVSLLDTDFATDPAPVCKDWMRAPEGPDLGINAGVLFH